MRQPADALPAFLFSGGPQAERRRLARLRNEGRIRSVGPRLYTSLPARALASGVLKSWAPIVAALFPGALVSHRTALEYVPDPDGVVFLTSTTNRRVSYAGLHLTFLRGPGPLADDQPFMQDRKSVV